ncbi:hypothetical protein JW859_09200 [bacterium]|nr:hypothetical protein [bacterium]
MLTFVIAGLVGFYCWIIPQPGCADAPPVSAPDTPDATPAWTIYEFQDGRLLSTDTTPVAAIPPSADCVWPVACPLPVDWEVLAAERADLTGDGEPEYALLVWRPWLDWPIMSWTGRASPIAGHQDADGNSCHLILLNPAGRDTEHQADHSYDLVWAGSALARPLTAIAVAELDDQPGTELLALESSYLAGREVPADCLSVWQWNGFGFSLLWRSEPGSYRDLRAIDLNGDGTAEILVR